MIKIGSTAWKKLISEGANRLDIQINLQQIEKFTSHALELLKWNQKINLTAITDPMEVAVKHFLDSIAPAPMIPPNASLLDIGSGGGFPGIPLKILIPSLSVTLIDASRKKVNFLKHIIRVLALEKIEAFHVRSEEFVKNQALAGTFNVIISRALSTMSEFVPMALSLLEQKGAIIAMKGKLYEKEAASVRSLINVDWNKRNEKKMKFKLTVKNYTLPYLKLERSLLILKMDKSSSF